MTYKDVNFLGAKNEFAKNIEILQLLYFSPNILHVEELSIH